MITMTIDALDCETNSPCQHFRKCKRTVWRICILMLGCKGLNNIRLSPCYINNSFGGKERANMSVS